MPAVENFEFFNPLKIISGKRALENLPIELQWLAASRPFCLWSGKGGKKRLAVVLKALKGSAMTLTVPEKMPHDPDSGQLELMAADFSAAACDALVVIGDHRQLQIAGQLSLLLSAQSPDPTPPSGTDGSPEPSLPLIHLYSGPFEPDQPPQADETATRRTPESPNLLPTLAVIDPRMIPRAHPLTAVSAALTVLAHCSETMAGPYRNPVLDSYAQVAIRIVMQHATSLAVKGALPTAGHALAMAMILCQCVRANAPAGFSHLLGEELSRVSQVPSGILTGIVLPYVLEVAARNTPDAVAELLLPLGGSELYSITADGLRARKAVNLIHELLHALNQCSGSRIPATLQQADISEEKLLQVARAASKRSLAPDPEALCLEILKHARLGRPLCIAGCPCDSRVAEV
jgi:alcohol dehydrogenase